MALEKSVLGFYVTNHPLRDVETLFQSYITLDTQTIRTAADKTTGIMGGLVSKIRLMTTKTGPNAGTRWAILLIEDLVGSMEVVLYSNEYQKFAEMIKPDAVLFFEGPSTKPAKNPPSKPAKSTPSTAVQKKKTREMLIQTSSMKLDDATLAALQKILKEHKGGTPVKIELSDLSSPSPIPPSASNCKSAAAAEAMASTSRTAASRPSEHSSAKSRSCPWAPTANPNAPPPPSPKRRCWRPVMNWWKWRNEVTTPSPSAPHPPRDSAAARNPAASHSRCISIFSKSTYPMSRVSFSCRAVSISRLMSFVPRPRFCQRSATMQRKTQPRCARECGSNGPRR